MHAAEPGVRVEEFDGVPQRVGGERLVGVEEEEDVAARGRRAPVAGRRHPLVAFGATPGMPGNAKWYWELPVREPEPSSLPWKLMSLRRIVLRLPPWYLYASLTAPSTASAPELGRKDMSRSPGSTAARLWERAAR